MIPYEVITDAQTELKLLVANNISLTPIQFKKKAEKIAKRAVNEIEYKGMKNADAFKLAVYGALLGFAQTKHTQFNNLLGDDIKLTDIYAVKQRVGLPEQAYQRSYQQRVKQAYNNLIESDAKYTPRVSLRNVSEQIVRKTDFDNKLDSLKEKTNLVIMSVHEDCADDHKDWQGKVYSLDGTSGKTKSGRKYVPIETVTGPQPKGIRPVGQYNCRHTFSEFKEYKKPITVSAKTRKEQYKITQTQRELERQTRNNREKYLMFKDVDPVRAKKYRLKAIEIRKAYETYSKANDRAFYRSRLSVI